MDDNRFDAAARALSGAAPRRGALAALLGGALALAGLAESQAKGGGGKGGKGKGKGGKKKKDKDKKPTCGVITATCVGSICGMGDYCCSSISCDCRQNLVCNYATGDAESGTCGCLPTEVMHNGRCGVKTGCISAGSRYDPASQICCSGSSHKEGPEEARYDVCDPGVLVCNTDGDCTGGSCRGYSCAAPPLDCNSLYL